MLSEMALGANRSKKLSASTIGHGLLLVPFALFFIVFEIVPMIWVAVNAFFVEDDEAWGLGNFTEILADAFYLQSFTNSLSLSFWSAFIGLMISAFAAASLQKVPGRMREWMVSFTNMTSNFAGVPLAFAFIIILGFNGSLTLLLKQWGLIENFNVYGIQGLFVRLFQFFGFRGFRSFLFLVADTFFGKIVQDFKIVRQRAGLVIIRQP